jgi:hypothetical protein
MAVIKLRSKSMKLDDIIAAGRRVTVDCQEQGCRAQTDLDPAFFAARRRDVKTLAELAGHIRCMACGSGKIILRPTPRP